MWIVRRAMLVGSTAVALVVNLICSPDAFAHAQLVKSEPARRAVISESPKQVKLWFNEEIEGAYATLTVLDSKEKAITENSPEVAADDPKLLTLAVPALPRGKYVVKYRVLSVDGHVVESTYDFTIKGN